MTDDLKGVITAVVYRYNPVIGEEIRYNTYHVKSEHGMTVLAILRYIFCNLDASLAFRDYDCYQGVCMSCLMTINGKRLRACSTMVEPGEEVTIEPIPGHHLVKDLVVSFD